MLSIKILINFTLVLLAFSNLFMIIMGINWVVALILNLIIILILSLLSRKHINRTLYELSLIVQDWKQGKWQSQTPITSLQEKNFILNLFKEMKNLQMQIISNAQSREHLLKMSLHKDLGLFLKKEVTARVSHQFTLSELEKNSRERNKYITILEGVQAGVIAVDMSRNVTWMNSIASSIVKSDPLKSLGRPIQEILKLYVEDVRLEVQNFCPVGESTSIFSQKGVELKNNENKIYLHLTTTPVANSGDANLGAIIILRDITAEQDLEKMKLDFVSMAAHELRTPLTTVQGYISFLQNPETIAKLSEEENNFMTKAFQSATRLNKLIENLLEVSRIEQGRMVIKAQKTQLDELVKRITEDFVTVAKNKGLKLIYISPSTPLPLVMVDAIRIEEVINNLIGNAIKYTDKGEIKVFMEAQDQFVILSVSDTGLGIPEEAMSGLFTKFYRVESNITAGAKGTGLGLYLSKNIIDAHGGRIWAESILGKGTVFSFSVPVA